MKRAIALFFIILLCFTITGCGKQQEYTDYTQYLTPSASENGTNGGQSPVQSAQFVGADADQLPVFRLKGEDRIGQQAHRCTLLPLPRPGQGAEAPRMRHPATLQTW